MPRALAEPVTALLDPTKRVFAPYLVSAAALALGVSFARGLSLRGALRETFSRDVWLHPSALADYRLILARAALRAATVGVRGVSSLIIAALLMSWLRVRFGAPGLHANALLVGAAFTVSAFVLEDAARFAAHWLGHRVPLLWAFHRVHHTAEVLTPFTLYRTHPVEAAINGAASALAVGAVTGLFAWAFGPSLRAWQLFGVDALGLAWALAGANLRHSHVWLSYGPRVERWLLSPAQHQVHHSADPRHVGRNLGTVFSLWDRLAGTLYVTSRPEALRFGLPEGVRDRDHTVRDMLLAPFASALSRVPRAPALLAVAALTSTCTTERFDRVSLLQGLARCTMQQQDEFQTLAEALATATAAHASAPTADTLAAARGAWERAIDAWERLELHRYGPAGERDTLGGQGLRAEIYAWPDVNRCLIEQRIVSRGYEGAAFAELPTSARGLAAVEYLLFFAGAENACAPTEAINATGAWAALGADEIARRKAAYARAAAADVVARARALRAAWAPAGFEAQLVGAGQGSALFRTQQSAFSTVAEAIFYLDTDVKDLRLATPLGLRNCATATCPAALESQWADRGARHLRNNLAGARALLEGCAAGDNQGFDDRLEAAGAGALAVRMRGALAAAEAAIDALPGGSLSRALATDPASVRRVHDAIKAITDFLKMEFSATLQIQSARVEGDND